MRKTIQFVPRGIYLFKSESCGNTCFFESIEEIKLFKRLLIIHLKKYIKVHNVLLKLDGYQMLVKIRDSRTLVANYKKEKYRTGAEIKQIFINEPWRIISEKMRVVHSVFAKTINKLRERTGVLVKSSYERFLFDSLEEAIAYIDNGNIIQETSQTNQKYKASKHHSFVYNWLYYKTRDWLTGLDLIKLNKLLLSKFIKATLLKHSIG